MKNLSLFMAIKFLRSKKNSRFTAIISKSSIIGISLGIAAIVVVMSIMNGFHSEMRDKILSMVSHVIITEKNYTLKNWQQLKKKVDNNELVIGSAPYVEGQAMFSYNGNVHGVQLKGIIFIAISPLTPVRVSFLKKLRASPIVILQFQVMKIYL